MTVTPFASVSAAEKPMEAYETPSDPEPGVDSTTHHNVENEKGAFRSPIPPPQWQQNQLCDSVPLGESGNRESTWLASNDIEMKSILSDSTDMKMAEACVKQHAFGNEGSQEKWLEAALRKYLNELSSFVTPIVSTCANRPSTTHAGVTQTTEVVDLTKDDPNDMQRAIARSIVDKGATKKDQDIEKAIEESLKANQGIAGFTPHEQLRAGESAVGLKNVDNSCWFNVIAQALFSVPRIRQTLLNFSNESCDQQTEAIEAAGVTKLDETEASQLDEATEDPLESDQVRLARALRRLFAFLLGSKRKYINPSEVLDLIAKLNTELNAAPSVGIQQDVTEMLLRLIAWLEQAFEPGGSGHAGGHQPRRERSTSKEGKLTLDEPGDSSGHSLIRSKSPTPASQAPESAPGYIVPSLPSSSLSISTDNGCSHSFKRIFHGSHVEERVSADGRMSSSTVDQSLHITNLRVEHETFHDSLAASQWQEDTPDNPTCEQWFMHVPPVIFFSLRRFSFDKSDRRTVKLHKEFGFPIEFFIDRYLHQNRDVVADKRMRVKEWRNQLDLVLTKLKEYDECPVGNEHRVPLVDLLKVCMQYMGVTINNRTVDDKGAGEPMDTSTNKVDIVAQPPPVSAPTFNRTGVPPAELAILDRLLNSSLQQATDEADGLRLQATDLRRDIDSAFDEPHLLEHSYRLHAVLIHEGEANVGHYWAYIADHATVTETGTPVAWRKYNNKTVEPATWDQVTADSYGTRRNCSAYCLIYVHKNRRDLFENDPSSTCSTMEEIVQSLPRDLAEVVEQDNERFVAEVVTLDEKQETQRVTAEEARRTTAASWLPPSETVDFSKQFDVASVDVHTQLAYKHLGHEAVAHALKSFAPGAPASQENYEAFVLKVAEWLITNIEDLCMFDEKSGNVDPRLMHIPIWLTIAGKDISQLVREMLISQLESLPSKSSCPEFNTALAMMLERLKEEKSADAPANDQHNVTDAKMDNEQLPYIADYAKSGRSRCHHCSILIKKNELRVGALKRTSCVDIYAWFHFRCFWKVANKKNAAINEASIGGMEMLKWDDQEKIRDKIADDDKCSMTITEREALKMQSDVQQSLLEQLMPLMDKGKNDLRMMLKQNNQEILRYTHVKKLMNHLIDCATFGALLPCPECKGQLEYSVLHRAYLCTRTPTAWYKCWYSAENPSRVKFAIPLQFNRRTWYNWLRAYINEQKLERLYVPGVRQQEIIESFLFADPNTSGSQVQDRGNGLKWGHSDMSQGGKQKLIIKNGAAIDPECLRDLPDVDHVLDDNEWPWNAVLVKFDLSPASFRNLYYKLQLLANKENTRYYIFRSWGRTGTPNGGTKTQNFGDNLLAAKQHFTSLFSSKSGCVWNKTYFERKPGKYFMVQMENDYKGYRWTSESPLKREIQEIVNMIFDIEDMEHIMKKLEIDISKMPLGQLTRNQISMANKLLVTLRNMMANEEQPSVKQIEAFTNRFYTMIPHNFGGNKPQLLNSIEIIEKTDMLHKLQDIELAYSFKIDAAEIDKRDPIDICFEKLNTKMEVLNTKSAEFDRLAKYVENSNEVADTHLKFKIKDIVAVNCEAQAQYSLPFETFHNRQLLWHGTQVTNLAGILSQGFLTPTGEHESKSNNGNIYGRGVYFADRVAEAAKYCYRLNTDILMLLCEVDLGNVQEEAFHKNITKLSDGKQSCKGIGQTIPDPREQYVGEDGVIIPLGRGMNIRESTDSNQSRYNEYIVYDVARIKIRYLVRMHISRA